MRTFYSPQDDAEEPVTCRCVPIKPVVAIVQFIAIIMLLAAIVHTGHTITYVVCTTYMFVTFVGFFMEEKITMTAHIFLCAIGALLAMGVALYFFYNFIEVVWHGDAKIVDAFVVLFFVFVFLLFVYYIWLCGRLLRASRYRTETLPEFDTTQGLFQFNSDAYDGSERANLVYPKL